MDAEFFCGLYIAFGVVLGIFIQICVHEHSPLVVESHVITSLPVTIEDPLLQQQTYVVPDATEYQPSTTTAPITMDQPYTTRNTTIEATCQTCIATLFLLSDSSKTRLQKSIHLFPKKKTLFCRVSCNSTSPTTSKQTLRLSQHNTTPISETTAFLILMSAGFLLYHSLSVFQTDMPKTRINFTIIAFVMGVSFMGSVYSLTTGLTGGGSG